ncbi:MAG: hypothetical protein Q7U88_04535 [Desulfocapsaceae bacterium]|nr:hypothetical protein [Desulfocapsaceae bacterium]
MVVNDFNIMTAFLEKKITTALAYLQQAMDGLHELRVSHTTDSKILFKNFIEIQHHLIAAIKEIKA